MRKLVMISVGLCLLVVVGLLAGCGGDDAAFVSRPTDVISGHWMLIQQSPVPAGVTSASVVGSDISILYTAGGLPRWSGNLVDHEGVAFDPNQGDWSKSNGVYRVKNSAGQWLEFVWVGSQLRSTTMYVEDAAGSQTDAAAAPTPYYQWWSRT